MAEESALNIAAEKVSDLMRSDILPDKHSITNALDVMLNYLSELDNANSSDKNEEFKLFKKIVDASKNPDLNRSVINSVIGKVWLLTSKNSYALAYRLGVEYGRKEVGIKSARRASDGRKLIGAASRGKVQREAEKLKHLSKEKAAQNIADTVSMSSGTVRRYLSEIFPGDSWKS